MHGLSAPAKVIFLNADSKGRVTDVKTGFRIRFSGITDRGLENGGSVNERFLYLVPCHSPQCLNCVRAQGRVSAII